MSIRKYLRFKPYLCRFQLLPGLTRMVFKSLRNGTYPGPPSYQKYEGGFREIVASRDPGMGLSLTKEEIYTLYSGILAVRNLEGAVAEVGVYRGGSAKVICEVKGNKPLYLFDTFEGMPDERISDSKDVWKKGTHTETSLWQVQTYINKYPEVYYVQGVFPDSISQYTEHAIENLSFSFVHLDVDLYQSTLDTLVFFYPRMVPGGRIVSHNYNLRKRIDGCSTAGVKAAFMEYFKDREHNIIEIAETQCMVIRS